MVARDFLDSLTMAALQTVSTYQMGLNLEKENDKLPIYAMH